MAATALLIVLARSARAQSVPTRTLRSVAAIMTGHGAQRAIVGSGFFVEVPSKAFPGSSFVYLVTAHHLLLDRNGAPRTGLSVALQDAKSGASREYPLPDERHWILDPRHESVDIAALPLSPQDANIAPIPLSQLFAEEAEPRIGALPEGVDVGAPCYYLSATALGAGTPRFVPVARFCRVSVAEAAEAAVAGVASQPLYFVDAGGPAELSGAPVFAMAGDRYLLFGLMEPQARSANVGLSGLAGVIPAGYVAETVEAMAAAQERKAGH